MPVIVTLPRPGVAIAQLLDGLSHQAAGVSIEQALRLLKRNLIREIKKHRISTLPTWEDAKLFTKSFPVQPAIIHKERRYPAGPRIALPVRYVELIDEREQQYCMLPDFSEILFIPEPALMRTMLTETVRSLTATLTPQQLHRLWPPTQSELRWMRLTLAEPSGLKRGTASRVLSEVSEPLTDNRNLALPSGSRGEVIGNLRRAILKGSCLVVGDVGVGKSTLIAIAAKELQQGRRAELKLKKERSPTGATTHMFWSSSGGRLIAGMRYLGQWQQRLEAVIAELADIDGVLVLENLLDLVSVGGREARDSLAAFLIPYLRSGSLRMVSEATPTELDACRRLLPGLVDALPLVHVAPMQIEHEVELLRTTLHNRLQSTDITYDAELPVHLSRLCRQFQRHSAPPGPAMRLVDELAGKRRLKTAEKSWTLSWMLGQFSKKTGLPLAMIDDAISLRKEEVAATLAKDVIGQDSACVEVAGVVTRAKSAVQDPKRPFGCLLLCGPTGVGKTQLAKSLSKYLFGASNDKVSLVRLDMSEYSGGSAGHRLLNDSEGNSASWIQQIRSKPLSVLLLDEIEKASGEVFDILLSVLDEGRLTDRLGRVTSFRNSVILMTSNLGARVGSSLGFSEDNRVDYRSVVRKSFRPEFFNRLDGVIAFSPLSREVIHRITEKELRDLCHREGLERYGRKLSWTPALVEHLAQVGFESNLGARPLQRFIETDVVAPLSKWLVEHANIGEQGLELDWDSDSCLRVQRFLL
jgi:ATP-dependent Clp protease ATP-binding subunit ClpC